MAAVAALLSLCFGALATPPVCSRIIITEGMQCGPGYSLISVHDVTRCGGILGDLLRSTGDGVEQTNQSLCAPALPSCPSDAGPQCIAEVASSLCYVRDLAVSPDDTLVAACEYNDLRVYNIITGATLTVPHYTSPQSSVFSPDGGKVAVAAYSRVGVVSLSNMTELWFDRSRYTYSVAYSPDGARVASGHSGGSIRIWNAETGDLVQSLTGAVSQWGRPDDVEILLYTLDGQRLLSAEGKNVVVWNATTGDILKTLTVHTRAVRTVKVSPDGLYFASLTETKEPVHIYKLNDYSIHKKIHIELSPSWSMTDMSFSKDSRKLVVVGNGAIEVYSVETGHLLGRHTTRGFWRAKGSYFHTSDTIITGAYDGEAQLLLWNDLTPTAPPTPAPAPTPDAPLAPCPSGAGSHCRAELARVPGSLRHIAVSHDDTLVAVASEVLHVFNVTTGAALTVPSYRHYSVRDVALSPAGDKVAVALYHGGVAVVSLSSGTELWWDPSEGRSDSIAYSPDGAHVASFHPDAHRIHIWEAATGALVQSLRTNSSSTGSLTYTPDGRHLLMAAGSVVVWDARTGAVLKTLASAGYLVQPDTQVSPDGLYFAILTWTYPRGVRIYRLSDYSVHKLIVVSTTVDRLSFSKDWIKLVAWGSSFMEVYSVETRRLLENHTMPMSMLTEASYFHTSDTIITSTNGSLLLWDDVTAPTPAPTPDPSPRTCTEDKACRAFGDATATCASSQHCACGTHSGALCEIPVAAPAPADVQVSAAITLWVPCDRASLQPLLDTLRAAATARGAQAVSVGASCGTLSVALSGVVRGATIAATVDALSGALGAAATAHSNLTNVTDASQIDPFVQTAQTSGSNTDAVCTHYALSTVQTYDGRCLVLTCKDGFALRVDTRDGKDYHTCNSVGTQPPATPSPGDGLSAGAIAGLVVACAVSLAVLVGVLVWWVRRAPDTEGQHQEPKQQQEQHSEQTNNEPVDV